MKPAPFDYHAPASLDEAVRLLTSLDNAKVLAGGQSLVPMMNFRYVIPDHVIDLNNIANLKGITREGTEMRIGAMTVQRDIEFSSIIAEACPLFQAALAHVGHRQTRNRGTIGGSLSHADPAAELPAVSAALDATVEIRSPGGDREIPISRFGTGFMETALGPDEILTSIRFTPWTSGHGYSFQEYARRHGDFAVVGVAVLLELAPDKAIRRLAIALCGVAVAPLRLTEIETALIGQPLTQPSLAEAAKIAGGIETITDIHAGTDYRRHLASILTTRALQEALTRAERVQ